MPPVPNTTGERLAALETTQSHLRSDISEIKGDVKALLAERNWRLGAAAAAGAIAGVLIRLLWVLPVLFLAGCAPQGPNGARFSWPRYLRPVTVVVDSSMSPACLRAAREGFGVVGSLVDYLTVIETRAPGKPLMGEIVVREAPPTGNDVLATTHKTTLRGRDILTAEIDLNGCGLTATENANVAAHELGHALGLKHAPEGLMREGRPFEWGLTEDEWWWIQ